MINISTVPQAKLNNRHNILKFHFVRAMISAGYISLNHIPSNDNISDILSKHWGYIDVYRSTLKPLFRHSGNTEDLYDNNDPLCLDGILLMEA